MMNRVVERLMNNLIVRRNWVNSLNMRTTSQCLHFSQAVKQVTDNYESNKKGLDFVNLNDDFRNVIKNVTKNYRTMNIEEVITTMDTLHKSLNNNGQLNAVNLISIEGFEYMCNTILKNARTLNTYNTIHVLHMLLSFNVSPNSVVVQTLLQLISVSVNQLTLGQIMMLYAMLHKVQEFPVTKALLQALPLALEQQALIELSIESTNLVKVLRFCSVIKNLNTKRHIINLIAKSNKRLNPKYIVDIFYAIYTLPELCTLSKSILIKINKVLENNAHILTFKEIEALLHYISMKFANSEMDFYNQTVIDTLCTVVLNRQPTFNESTLIIKHLNKMRYSNIDLLNHILENCLKDKDVFERCTEMRIFYLIKALVIANYKLHNWKIVEKMLLDRVVLMEYSLPVAASMAVCLLSLDCYCPEFLNKVFTLYNLYNYTEEKQTMLIMFKLHWYLKVIYPQYQGAMLDKNKLNKIIVEHESNNMPHLRESLEEAVGASKYVKNNLITKIGESVDHAIVMQQDGSFLNIKNNDITFAEELDLFSGCSKILFFGYPEEAYCTNTKNLLLTVKMSLKAIETSTGFYSFVINPFLWKNFSSNERIKHLQEGIKLKCSKSSN